MYPYFAFLPDDIIEKIYSKIYFPQNSALLNDIKLYHFIKHELVKNYGLYNICCCAMIHGKYNNNISSIVLTDIDSIHNTIYNMSYDDKSILLNKIIGRMSLNDKYFFIFLIMDKTIRGDKYNYENYIKYVVDNHIKNTYYILK